MNNEFAFDQNELKEILTYHLNGNEYRLFDFISYKCRINNNWWEYTNEQWEELTGMSHRTFLTTKKSLEDKGYITNLNKGQRTKNIDGTISNKRNRLSVNVDFILSLKKEREQKSSYNFKSNFQKELSTELVPKSEETKGAKIALMVKETKTKGAKDCITKGAKFALDNNKIKKQENKENTSNYSNTTSTIKESENETYLTKDEIMELKLRTDIAYINNNPKYDWINKWIDTINLINGKKLTTTSRSIIIKQLDELYYSRENNNLNMDYTILRKRAEELEYMETSISQVEIENLKSSDSISNSQVNEDEVMYSKRSYPSTMVGLA